MLSLPFGMAVGFFSFGRPWHGLTLRCLPDPIMNLCCCVCLAGGEEVFLCKLLHNEVAGDRKKWTTRPL